MKYFYIAAGINGKKVKGFVEATETSKAAQFLRERHLLPIRIEQQKEHTYLPHLQIFKRMGNRDIALFTRQVSTMLTSGLTLTQSLEIIKNQVRKQSVAVVVDSLITSIEEGKSLSDSLAQFPDLFSPIYISLVKAGESAGLLDKVLIRLADSLEKRDKINAKVRGALLYPAIVLTLMVIVTIIMLIFVIPQLSSLYDSMELQMPLPTQIIVGISEFITQYILLIIITIFAIVFYFNKWRRSESGKRIIDNLILNIPFFGKMFHYSILTEFSRTFGLLISTGTLVIDGLLKSADVLGNTVYKQAVLKLAENVEKGVSIGDAMNANPLFPAILIEMVKVGEQTGKLDESLMRVSEYFEQEDEQIVHTLTTSLEPFIMIILAIGVGILIISVVTPIYNLLSSFQ